MVVGGINQPHAVLEVLTVRHELGEGVLELVVLLIDAFYPAQHCHLH